MSDGASAEAGRVAHGSNLAAISRRIVGLIKEHYGKGPTGARTFQFGDLVVVLLSGGYTQAEKTLIASGRQDVVSAQRAAFQDAMYPLFRQVVEEELRRPVIAFMSATHNDPDLNVELFILESESGELDRLLDEPPDGRDTAPGSV
jgi:uncharacterized protein YbcI